MAARRPTRANNTNDGTRRWERHATSIPVNVTVSMNGERSAFRGEACILSRGGMCLFLTRELDPGTTMSLDFLVPYEAAQLIVRGVIRNRTGFTHGVEFLNPTFHQQQMIERTCKAFKLPR